MSSLLLFDDIGASLAAACVLLLLLLLSASLCSPCPPGPQSTWPRAAGVEELQHGLFWAVRGSSAPVGVFRVAFRFLNRDSYSFFFQTSTCCEHIRGENKKVCGGGNGCDARCFGPLLFLGRFGALRFLGLAGVAWLGRPCCRDRIAASLIVLWRFACSA